MSATYPKPWTFSADDEFEDTPIRDANGEYVLIRDSGVYPPDLDTCREIVEAVNNYEVLIQERRRLIGELDAALSAPPRNCDRFANAAQALGAYPDGPPIGDDWDDADWMMLLDWLFAKAKEAQP